MNRTKKLDVDMMRTPLNRCLTTVDITLLGIGHMIGAGIYVLTGDVAKNVAGPAIVVSFIVAGITSLLAAICYAEFGARVPKAGSSYVYTYVTIGEFWAFVLGQLPCSSLRGPSSTSNRSMDSVQCSNCSHVQGGTSCWNT